ncbi:MAG TPA: ATP-binding protein [Ilumatobacteraceae bacterium]|nr:ATP-binding protein [Ilumatobacteraceae bacterium]
MEARDGRDDALDERSIALPGQRQSVRQARQFVVDYLTPVADPDIVDDFKLVASELVTNAIEYGAAQRVAVTVACSDGEIRLAVRGGRGTLPDLETVQMAPPDQLSGRGLSIVRELTDSIHVDDSQADHEIIVTRRLR